MIKIPERIQDTYVQLGELKEDRRTRDVALLGARIALAWVFVYHGAYTLFGAFGGPGIHRASIFYGTVAHLHPATFFTVLGGSIEFFGGIAVGLGILGRLAALGLTGDMAVAMATVTFGNGIASAAPGRLRAEPGPGRPGVCRRSARHRSILARCRVARLVGEDPVIGFEHGRRGRPRPTASSNPGFLASPPARR